MAQRIFGWVLPSGEFVEVSQCDHNDLDNLKGGMIGFRWVAHCLFDPTQVVIFRLEQ